MESNEREADPQQDLDEAARIQAAMGARAQQSRSLWLVLGAGLGLVHATRGLPPEWGWLATTLALAGMAAMIGIMWRARALMRSTGVRLRWWGGPWWIVVLLSVVIVTGIAILRPLPTTSGWHPGYLISGVVLAAVYTIGAVVADRIRMSYTTRRRA